MGMRIVISGLALTLGLTSGAIAAGSYGLSSTVLDPNTVEPAATELLSDKSNTNAVVNQLDNIMGVAIGAGTAANGDPAFAANVAEKRAKVRAAAESALNDPHLRAAVRNALTSLQSQVAGLSNGTVTVEGTAISAAAHNELAKQDPQLAAALPEQLKAVTITSRETSAGDRWLTTLQRMTGQLALVALGLIAAAILISPNRAGVLRRIGKWGLVVGGLPVALFALLPEFVLPHLGAIGTTLAALLEGGSALVGPAWVLTLGGLLLTVTAGTVAKRNALLGLIPAKR